MTPQQLKQIKTTLAKDLDIVNLPDCLRDEIISKISATAVLGVTKETIKRLSEVERQKLADIQKKGDPAYLQQFLEESIPGYDKLLTSVISDTLTRHKKGVGVA